MHTRRAAISILNSVDEGSAFSSKLLARYSRNQRVVFPLLQKMVKGTLSWKERIDETLRGAMSARDVGGLRSDWNILRVAAYQFLYLEEVPIALVLKESCALASSKGNHLLMRTVLHRVLEQRGVPEDKPQAAGSHPAWVLAEWEEAFGKAETEKLCQANNVRWPVSIRTNTLRTTPHQLEKFLRRDRVVVHRSAVAKDCFVVDSLPKDVRLHELLSFEKGLFQVQDESAALVGILLGPQEGESIIDLCAAPGGKTTHLAALMKNTGKVLAVDLHDSALQKLKENCRKLGVKNVRTIQTDGASLKVPFKADAVLVDAPCSGLGVLGRKVDIRWSKSKEQIPELAELQLRLLSHAATLLKPGGRLVYSTCTLHRSENQLVVKAFLNAHPEFELVHAREAGLGELATKEGYLLTLPHRHKMGGGFAALLRHRSAPRVTKQGPEAGTGLIPGNLSKI